MSFSQNKLAIYQAKNGAIELNVDARHETILATQEQMSVIFGVQRPAITKHLKNIFEEEELREDSVRSILEHTASDGKTYKTKYYNLDVIISVGYRVNSKQATAFRQWATKTLKSYITDGFVINKKHVQQNYSQFLKAIDDIKLLSSNNEESLELIKAFASTWFSLDAFDKDEMPTEGANKKQVIVTTEHLKTAIANLKADLIANNQATDLFAQERNHDAIESIVGNVFQSFSGEDVYPTLEEKAAHLLYFVVKNHPFSDGNKRSGAFTFIWYLQKAGALSLSQITPAALTALTLLIAQSDPKQKDRMIGLVLLLLGKNNYQIRC